ncbi:prokaryotic type I DNA topoisomerase [Cyathus striatus]|nr:prokaryotic type I DNA topoisomerase [Cyathus striatus]
MTRVLCVAEKPSIAKSISQILSGGQFQTEATRTNFIKNYKFPYPQTNSLFVVTSVVGHLTATEFHETHRKWHSCDPFDLFEAPVKVEVHSDKKNIEANLKMLARNNDVLMIWTDCDREGEHIGWEIWNVCSSVNRNLTLQRARFSAIIAEQIHRAAQRPVDLDRAQADAVEARIIIDLKIGAAFTRMQTLALQQYLPQTEERAGMISYGSCQFPTLGFVVQRYQRVKDFVPETFWYIYLILSHRNDLQQVEDVEFKWKRGHIFDREFVVALYEHILTFPRARVVSVTKKQTKKWKPLPLTTVELQKAGSRLLRMAPKKVLDIAERLYQQGFLSYPRTETDQYDNQFDFHALINKQAAENAPWIDFVRRRVLSLQHDDFSPPRKGKNNDKAHPPIHPTNFAGNLAGDEKKVYEYITRRFLASCSKDAIGYQTTIEVEYGGEQFSATGIIVIERNYLDVYPYDKWTDCAIPLFDEGAEFEPTICEMKEGQTSKPNLLTEADLVTLMDKNGIGTDATIAQHIQTIIDRDYVIERMEGSTKYLVPSTLGIGLIEGYNQIGLEKSVSKPQLRRETERAMVQVCQGALTKEDMLIQSINQYKDMFIITRREFNTVVRVPEHYKEVVVVMVEEEEEEAVTMTIAIITMVVVVDGGAEVGAEAPEVVEGGEGQRLLPLLVLEGVGEGVGEGEDHRAGYNTRI